jgi:hypothetical protein
LQVRSEVFTSFAGDNVSTEPLKITRSVSVIESRCQLCIHMNIYCPTTHSISAVPPLSAHHILENDEVDFLQAFHETFYFGYGKKRFYLRNGVHQGSTISPALFGCDGAGCCLKLKLYLLAQIIR